MEIITQLKALSLTLAMALGMLLPATMYAQGGNDNMFQVENAFSGNRDIATTWVLINNGIGQSEAPLGSGLLILGAAGAGYVLAKRRHSRKGMTLVLALALMLSTTQCKKNVGTISDAATNGVYITLNVGGDEKVGVDPTNGGSNDYAKVTWETDDVIYVGNNGAYCGFLKYDGEKFAGTINPTSGDDADYLHFYFMGNKGPEGNPTGNYSITDQTEKYPVISYGRSTSLYQQGRTEYSTTLFNKCAIVKFTTTDIDADITITGMNNMVSVDFSKNNGADDPVNPFTYTKDGEGSIKLHKESNTERWAILLPQDEVTTATASAPNYVTESAFTIPEIAANTYHSFGVTVTLAKLPYIDAYFSVSDTKTVKFSRGNLQYKEGEGWRFASNQYDYVGSWNSSSWVDLFGWGTWSGTSEQWSPLNTSDDPKNYSWNGDKYFQGSIGGYSNWYTLTEGEWIYLLRERPTGVTVNDTKNARYTEATININGNPVNGVILFPDNYAGGTPSGVTWGSINISSIWSTRCTTAGWSSLEAAGCVFLPAAGYRYGTDFYKAGLYGIYWSSTDNGDKDAFHLYFYSAFMDPLSYSNRYRGCSVRFVIIVGTN